MQQPSFLSSLTDLAKRGELETSIGRNKEIASMTSIITEEFGMVSLLLLGPPGIGKTEAVRGLTQYLLDQKPNYEVYELDLTTLEADTGLIGTLQGKLNELFVFTAEKKERIIFIDEFHTLIGMGTHTGKQTGIEQNLKAALTSGRIRIIAATTDDEFQRFVGKDPALARRFNRFLLEELTPEYTLKLLQKINSSSRMRGLPYLSNESLMKIIQESKDCYPQVAQPAAAIKTMNEISSKSRDQKATGANFNGSILPVMEEIVALLKKTKEINTLKKHLTQYITGPSSNLISKDVVDENLKKMRANL